MFSCIDIAALNWSGCIDADWLYKSDPADWLQAASVTFALGIAIFVPWSIHRREARERTDALLVALTSELKVMRDDFNIHISVLRKSMQSQSDKRLVRPDDFSASTVVFDANAGSLGQLGDADLVENLVEIYSQVHQLRDTANRYSAVPNDFIERNDVQQHHYSATAMQIGVMQLHNRLKHGKDTGPRSIHDTEEETRKLCKHWSQQIARKGDSIDYSYPVEFPINPRSD